MVHQNYVTLRPCQILYEQPNADKIYKTDALTTVQRSGITELLNMVGEGIYFEEIRDRLHSNINGVLWITKTWIHKQNSFRTVTLVLHLKRWAWDAIFKVVKLEGHRKHRRTICPSTQSEVKSTGTSIPIDNSELHQALNQRIILYTYFIPYYTVGMQFLKR